MYKARLGGCVDGENEDHGYLETDPTGRYGRFKEVLGKGAMKTVYVAFDEVLGMEVAWNQAKLNDVFRSPEELQRLYSEVHLLSTLKHESIIRYHTSWIDVDNRTFNFITEMFTSGTLREYRRRFPRVDIRAVKNWARQILRGLVYLHGHDPPVIHRDLKCDNIFVNGHLGQVKIGDLGFAAILRGSQTAHSVIGTPEFMAPELYEEEYNELVDIYSFGMCVLEMLTSEYPYSECSNPAQIYKKVTSGKLPEAFYRIQDVEARKFVGQCLEKASKRLPAEELLLDPFLASDEMTELLPIPIESHEPFPAYVEHGNPEYETKPLNRTRSTDVTITGKMNLEDDTIYLKVQIADKDGSVRNVYFPYDVVSDTALDVATEMVKELEITDREPHEIAKVIEAEISALVSQSKECDPLQLHQHHSSTYEEEDEDDPHHPLYSLSSRSSSQASLPDLMFPHGTRFPRCLDVRDGCDWLPDGLFVDDDTSSECSLQSCNYSNLNYNSGNEQDFDVSPRRRDNNQYSIQSIAKAQRSTRFCPAGNIQCKVLPRPQVASSSSGCRTSESHRLTRNRSLVDVRSQLLHRSLVEEVNKRRLFNTVGAVENIGYQAPCEPSGKVLRPIGGGCSVGTRRDGKKKGYR